MSASITRALSGHAGPWVPLPLLSRAPSASECSRASSPLFTAKRGRAEGLASGLGEPPSDGTSGFGNAQGQGFRAALGHTRISRCKEKAAELQAAVTLVSLAQLCSSRLWRLSDPLPERRDQESSAGRSERAQVGPAPGLTPALQLRVAGFPGPQLARR